MLEEELIQLVERLTLQEKCEKQGVELKKAYSARPTKL